MEIYEMLGITKAEYERKKQEAREEIKNAKPDPAESCDGPGRPEEVPAEVWGNLNGLMSFCYGVFEDWELSELQRHLDKIAATPPEERSFHPDVESILLMQSMLKSHFYKRR